MQFIFKMMKKYFLFLHVLDSKNSKDNQLFCAAVCSPVLTWIIDRVQKSMFTSQFIVFS